MEALVLLPIVGVVVLVVVVLSRQAARKEAQQQYRRALHQAAPLGSDLACPKCQGDMVQGFVCDHTHGGGVIVSLWVEGSPETGWAGIRHLERSIPIGAYRCSSCGYLESYARPEFEAK